MADILVHRIGLVGTVAISNVDKFNAMTADMWRALPQRIAQLDADPAIHAIVLVGDGDGDGDKAFVSGADISQFGVERGDAASQQVYGDAVDAAYLAPVRASKPVIAQIRGICMVEFSGFSLPARALRHHGALPDEVLISMRPQSVDLNRERMAGDGGRCCVEGRVQRRSYLGEAWDYHIANPGRAEARRVSARPLEVFEVDQQVFARFDPSQLTYLPTAQESTDGVAA